MKGKLSLLGTILVLAVGLFLYSGITMAGDVRNMGRATFGVL